MNLRRRSRGFSLVELSAVLIALGLVSVLLARFLGTAQEQRAPAGEPGPRLAGIAHQDRSRIQAPVYEVAGVRVLDDLGQITYQIKPLALYMASDASSYMTGSHVVIDGGMMLGKF